MARINLLPWREALRKEKQQEYLVTLGAFAVIAAVVVGGVHFYNNQKIDYQKSRNAYLDEQIVFLDKKIEEIRELEKQKDRLLARMRAIEELQGNRPLIVRLFDEVVQSIPDGVSLNNLTQKNQKVTINGVAQSNARVSSFMRNLDKSEWLTNPMLDVVQTNTGDAKRVSNFTLRFDQVLPKSESESDEGMEE